jgi:hypothetical protein
MKALFQLSDFESEWVDTYTGQVRRAAPGQTAEHQGKEFQSAASHRRELDGYRDEAPKKRPEPEEQLAEIVLPPRPHSQDFMKGASKFFGGNASSSAASQGSKMATIHTPLPLAPMRNAPLKKESLNAGTTIPSTGQGLKQSASSGVGAKIKTRDAQPNPLEIDHRQINSNIPASYELHQGEKTFHDQVSQRSVPNYTPIELEAKLKLRESSLSRDIVLDILMMKGYEPAHQTVATNELHDIAVKLSVPTSSKIQQSIDFLTQALVDSSDAPLDTSLLNHNTLAQKSTGIHQASQRGTQDLRVFQELQEEIIKKPKGLSSDVFIALERATSQTLKDDPLEQFRLGTWAVHVLASRMETPATELLRGMKRDAVLALGRLSMQLLSSSAQAQNAFNVDSARVKVSSSFQSVQDTTLRGRTAGGAPAEASEITEEQEPELPMSLPNRKTTEAIARSSIRGANDFFRLEAIQSDLQALQNNISLEFTADMLVEGFIESLRNDDLDTTQEAMRTDILSQFQAQEVPSSNLGVRGVNAPLERSSMKILGMKAMGGKETSFRETGPKYERPVDVTGDFGMKRGGGVLQEKKKISFFPTVDVIETKSDEGAWTMIPESKYVE